jgi:FkbM family methyltransferase
MKQLPFRVEQDSDLEKWRVATFWDKEPETIAWIESFEPTSRFLDIGANIGLYSLYAASLGHRVWTIEPNPGNFQALIINTRKLNRPLPIIAIWGAVGSISSMADFRCSDLTPGCTGGGYTAEIGLPTPIKVYTIDELIQIYLPFDHIKIDVDGEEDLIVDGMIATLDKGIVRSYLIEIAPEHRHYIVDMLTDFGYTMNNQFNRMTPHSRERRLKEDIDVENIIFTRL